MIVAWAGASRRAPKWLCATISLVSAHALAACDNSKAKGGVAEPAQIRGHIAESDLVTVTLTPEAEARLGIALAKVERRSVAQTRTLGGEVLVPNGASAMTRYAVSASMDAATLASTQIDADGAVMKAQVALDAARQKFERIDRLFKQQAESERVRDEAQAEVRTAEVALRTARSQRALLGQSISSTSTPRQVWVRSPVYAGDLKRINPRATVQVKGLGSTRPTRTGRPIAAPATANTQSATVNLFYEVDNRDGAFRMGDRVEVSAPTNEQREELVVPYAALLYDINGGEWVYERTAPNVFARRRVQVRAIVGDTVVLARGPEAGVEIVTQGVAELFGTEFGVSH